MGRGLPFRSQARPAAFEIPATPHIFVASRCAPDWRFLAPETSLTHTILIASYLEPEHVERIRQVDRAVEVLYDPELVARPRYAADHTGGPFSRTPDQEQRWRAMLARATILFDFDRPAGRDLPALAPRVRWIQATSAGIGEYMSRMGYGQSMPQTVYTTASGVHAQPLMEFCFMVMFALHKQLPHALREQRARRWARFATGEVRGQTLAIVGVGGVGKEIARIGQQLGMRTIGVKRSVAGVDPASLHLDLLYGQGDLAKALPEAQNLVLIAPHTSETEGMIGARELALLPAGAVFINVARGALVDEQALVGALRSGHLLGAGLDVFREEPLPAESPLWAMDNVFIFPHSASTTDRENARITDLFCENLRLYLAGKPLRNRFEMDRGF